jgi:CubicO group peptidase (beta-lactamase class C family)
MSADRTVSTATGTFDRSAAGRGPTDEQHGEPVRQRLEPAVEVLRHSAGNDPDRHAFPGAVAGVAHRGRVVLCEAIGSCSAERGAPSMTTDAVFDAASLTKVVVTTTAVLRLVERGSVALDDAIAWHIPELTGTPAGRASVAQLLTHTAGVPWLPFYAEGVDWGGWLAAIAQTLPVVDPGTRVHYSCTGFILLGRLVEVATGEALAEFAAREIFTPLEMVDTQFLPLADPLPEGLVERLVATERRKDCNRGRALAAAMERRNELSAAWQARHPAGSARGVVHDENAAWLGGSAGNAGLFTTATDLLAFGQMYLDHGRHGPSPFLSDAAIETATRDWTPNLGEHRGLGWKISGPEGALCDLASPAAYGHTGFTGAALLIDPERDAVAVLLTNRLQFGRTNERILRVRRLFLNAVLAAVTSDDR